MTLETRRFRQAVILLVVGWICLKIHLRSADLPYVVSLFRFWYSRQDGRWRKRFLIPSHLDGTGSIERTWMMLVLGSRVPVTFTFRPAFFPASSGVSSL